MTQNSERFEAIYDTYSGDILAYASRRCAQLSDAADIASETFSVAWRRIDDVPPGPDARPWLYGVARNVLLNHQRSTLRRVRLTAKTTAAVESMMRSSHNDAPFVDEVIERIDGVSTTMITTALEQLSESDRELLTLIAWDGLTPADAAVVLGCSPETARVRLHRARQRFSVFLDQVQRSAPSGQVSLTQASACSSSKEAP